MAISVVGVDLSKSVFQLSLAETGQLETTNQPDPVVTVDPSHLPQGLAEYDRGRPCQLGRV